ncbi:nitrogen regulatory IIA protein [Flavobacterium dauae]|uniref:nitrogen regulatory IIA protein n=1 Tax=Flavobacterium dauae TaxID=1563479 RepID=UPI00101CF5D9|nr:nitrogen regulatory IIA protein [Flavobacterium dauae]WLD24309.1 nitrogen regulatory IIA protein [Flavobacterium dauae]
MKNLRTKTERYFDRLDDLWRALPLRKQYRYTLFLFTAYLLLTAGVICSVWYHTSQSGNKTAVHSLDRTVVRDSLSTVFKNRIYEEE